MAAAAAAVGVVALLLLLPLAASAYGDGLGRAAVGVNWGTMTSHPILPCEVVRMLAANGVARVKMFDADPWTAAPLAHTGIQVMLAVPNDQLARLAGDPRRAYRWAEQNVSAYLEAGVDVRYVRAPTAALARSTGGVLWFASAAGAVSRVLLVCGCMPSVRCCVR